MHTDRGLNHARGEGNPDNRARQEAATLGGTCPREGFSDVLLLDDDHVDEELTPALWVAIARERRPRLPETTDWFDGSTAPVRIGWYERYFVNSPSNLSEARMHYWDGACWRRTPIARMHYAQQGDYPAWRGLAADSIDSPPISLHWDRTGVFVHQ